MSVVIGVVVALAIAWLVVRALSARQQQRALRGARWELAERSDGELVSVFAEHPANERLLIGAVPISASDFGQRLEDVRAEGREKIVALNAR